MGALLGGLCCGISISTQTSAQEQTTQQLPLPQGQAQAQSEDKRWQITFDSEFRYFSSKETSPTVPGFIKTTFKYTPIGFSLAAIPSDDWKIEVGVRGGYQDLLQKASTGARATFSGWTDTSVVGTLTYYGFNGFQPFVSLASNVPTGNSFVKTNIVNVPQDPDVTQVNGFGEGLNIGPTIGVNVPITPDLLATFSLGHTVRGGFARLGPNLGINEPGFGFQQNVSPGDVTTVVASLGYQAGSWSFQGSAFYSGEQTTKVDGANFFQTGGKFGLSAAAGYAWTEDLSSKLTGTVTHTGRNRVPLNAFLGNFGLHTETFNTNSDVFTLQLDTTYRFGSLAIGPSLGVLYRDHNGYDTDTSLFVPAKLKWSAGGALTYALNDTISLNARAEHFWVALGPDPGFLPAAPRLHTEGWMLSVGARAQF